MGTFPTDVRVALRGLVRRPVFFATAALTVALGIGASVAVFTVVNGFLLKPLPYEDPDELVFLWDENQELGWRKTDVSPANAWDWRARSRSLEDLAVFYDERLNLSGDGSPELVSGVRVTPNMLDLLGRAPSFGRSFTEDELGEGRGRVVVLTDGFWARRFGRDPDVLGSTLELDGHDHTVVGILPEDFLFLDRRPDLLLPHDVHPMLAERSGHYARALGRLAEGAELADAREELRAIAAELASEHPEDNGGWTVEVVSAREDLLGPVARQASFVLLAAVGFVLLMACVNVGTLLLARSGTRRRELAVRAALGAGRGRMVRQLLTESLVLGLIGGALGLLIGVIGSRGIVGALPPQMPPVFQFGVDGAVLLFVVGVTLASVVMFGLAPALRSAREVSDTLRAGGWTGPGRSVGRFGATLVVLQTAMAVLLLVGGGLLIKSIAGMRNQDFGFDPEGVVALRVAPPAATYPDPADLRSFWQAVEDRVRALPGVVAVGTTQSHPLMGSNWGNTIRIAGRDEGAGADRTVRTTYASPGLFDALGVQVVRGRGIGEEDHAEARPVAVVNETFVARYLGVDVDPLAHAISRASDEMPDIPIVGVVRDFVERSIDDPVEPSWYLPISHASVRARSIVVRTDGPAGDVVPAVREAVWSVDPGLPVFEVETMVGLIDRRVGGYAVIAELMGAFALLALLLGAVGIYGVTAYQTDRRRGEIGVRLAMGAERGDVVRMVVLAGARRLAVGLIVGLAAALALSEFLGSVLVGVDPNDPVVFGTVTLVLTGISLLGLYLPARRAARVDAVRALAAE